MCGQFYCPDHPQLYPALGCPGLSWLSWLCALTHSSMCRELIEQASN